MPVPQCYINQYTFLYSFVGVHPSQYTPLCCFLAHQKQCKETHFATFTQADLARSGMCTDSSKGFSAAGERAPHKDEADPTPRLTLDGAGLNRCCPSQPADGHGPSLWGRLLRQTPPPNRSDSRETEGPDKDGMGEGWGKGEKEMSNFLASVGRPGTIHGGENGVCQPFSFQPSK